MSGASIITQMLVAHIWVNQLTVISTTTVTKLQILLACFWVFVMAILPKFTFAVYIEPANVSCYISVAAAVVSAAVAIAAAVVDAAAAAATAQWTHRWK